MVFLSPCNRNNNTDEKFCAARTLRWWIYFESFSNSGRTSGFKSNADINKKIGDIENKEIKLAEGFSHTEKAKELLDKLKTMRVIKN